MLHEKDRQVLIHSVKGKCKACYACVRKCKAKAIRIENGRSSLIPERCISCGHCVLVCSQKAIAVDSCIAKVKELLAQEGVIKIAIISPSFPAEFDEVHDYRLFLGMIKKMGFDQIHEAAIGADLVAHAYRKLLSDHPQDRYIASTCPAVVRYIQYYHPSLVPHLAPIVSPMVAAARALKSMYRNAKIVFIGPCIAKKEENKELEPKDAMEGVLTFAELRQMLGKLRITAEDVEPANFDPPFASRGGLFPIPGGLLDMAGLKENPIDGDVIVADGQSSFISTIRQLEKGFRDVRLVEMLCCKGCIMGPGITKNEKPLYERRALVIAQSQRRLEETAGSHHVWDFLDLDLSRSFKADDRRMSTPSETAMRGILEEMGKFTPNDELDCGACGYDTCRDHAKAIFNGLAEIEMCLPHTIEQLKVTVQKLADSTDEVATIQNQLRHAEKLASMGQLAAGVAHEVNNPLGVVLMYSHLLKEKCAADPDLEEYVTMIVSQADRCRRIIAGLLNFARQNKTIYQEVNLPQLVKESLKALSVPSMITITIEDNMQNPTVEMDPDQISQALTNLYTNAQAAMPQGGKLTVTLEENKDMIAISVSDTGVGIPERNLSKIFDPFFTTKQIGTGTGLGLAVLYGIVKMHRGHVKVVSNDDPEKGPTGTTFTMTLPRRELS